MKFTIIYKEWIEIDLWIFFKYKFPTTILWLFHNTNNENWYTGIETLYLNIKCRYLSYTILEYSE